jgi:hypothetical protein
MKHRKKVRLRHLLKSLVSRQVVGEPWHERGKVLASRACFQPLAKCSVLGVMMVHVMMTKFEYGFLVKSQLRSRSRTCLCASTTTGHIVSSSLDLSDSSVAESINGITQSIRRLFICVVFACDIQRLGASLAIANFSTQTKTANSVIRRTTVVGRPLT